MKVAILYDEQYRTYDIHRANMFFRIFGPSIFTYITCDSTRDNALEAAKRRIKGKTKVLDYASL